MTDEITKFGELFLVLVGVLAALVAGVRKIYKSARWMEDVHKQMHPNGGASIRDVLDRIEMRQEAMAQRMDRFEDFVIAHSNRQDAARSTSEAA